MKQWLKGKHLHKRFGESGIVFLLAVVLMLTFSACVAEGNNSGQLEEYLVLEQETVECLLLGEDLQGILLGTQFYEGEIVQFWGVEKVDESRSRSLDIYLCRESSQRRLIFEGVDTSYGGQWFMDKDGNYYILGTNELVKLDGKGNLFFRKEIRGGSLVDICQLADGRLYLMKHMDAGGMKLLALEEDTGEMSVLEYVALGDGFNQSITSGEDGLLLLYDEGVWSLDVTNGARTKRMGLAEYDYEVGILPGDFRITGENVAEILYSGTKDILLVQDIAKSRTIITVKTERFFDNAFMREQIILFNRRSDSFYVVAEVFKEGDDLVDFHGETNVEIGTGGGPDIIFYNALNEPESLMEKGAFEDLRPYLEASGLKEEDFFSAAFDFWKEGESIYAVNMVARPTGLWIREELLGSRQVPDLESLLDAMLAYEEKACFHPYWESKQVLEYFLAGSEDLWGMIDWEQNSCDFGGELFAKLLEVAMRYGWNATQDLPYVAYPMSVDFYSYDTQKQMAEEGKVVVGYLFEDGCYQRINQTGVMMINANADAIHKEGAWEFMLHLLSEEVQTSIATNPYPVLKSAFEANVEREIEEGSIVLTVGTDGSTTKIFKAGIEDFEAVNHDEAAYRELNDLTEEKAEEIRILLATSKALPTRSIPLIAIVNEEVGAYFNGSKSVEEVVEVLENRIKLYLEER